MDGAIKQTEFGAADEDWSLVDDLSDAAAAWAFYRSIGSPKFVTAPMVNASELAFRMLTRRYGAQLAFTPMIHARMCLLNKAMLEKEFTTCSEDRPLAVQFCANDPEVLLEVARRVEDRCDMIDINLGCPQNIAKRGHYGAFLLEDDWQLISDMISTLKRNLKVPVTCKIRILECPKRTLALARLIERSGCSMLTVHGRTKKEIKERIGPTNFEMIRRIKDAVAIPVIANGGVETYDDAIEVLRRTGADGVMSSEGLLENPALFSNQPFNRLDLAREYCQIARQCDTPGGYYRVHFSKLFFPFMKSQPSFRDVMQKWNHEDDPEHLIAAARSILADPQLRLEIEAAGSWYKRYWQRLKIGTCKAADAEISASIVQHEEVETPDYISRLFDDRS